MDEVGRRSKAECLKVGGLEYWLKVEAQLPMGLEKCFGGQIRRFRQYGWVTDDEGEEDSSWEGERNL